MNNAGAGYEYFYNTFKEMWYNQNRPTNYDVFYPQ